MEWLPVPLPFSLESVSKSPRRHSLDCLNRCCLYPYTSAVSKKLIPPSRALLKAWLISVALYLELKPAFSSPQPMVPKPTVLTTKPDLPRRLSRAQVCVSSCASSPDEDEEE